MSFALLLIRMTGHLGVLFLFLLLLTGFAAASPQPIILATTTSLQDAGLLDLLIPLFERQSGYRVKAVAVGSGQAIAMGRRGEADLLLAHAPKDEQDFMAKGFGSRRRAVMQNDFVLVGPPRDPAQTRGQPISEALKRISRTQTLFLSRGDYSGTHSRERELWRLAALSPEGKRWYQETGLGMGQTLSIASEKRGYTLTDRGSWLALRKNLTLELLVQGDADLINSYHVIEVSPAVNPRINAAGARALADFLVSPATQALIGRFGVSDYGQALFVPTFRTETLKKRK